MYQTYFLSTKFDANYIMKYSKFIIKIYRRKRGELKIMEFYVLANTNEEEVYYDIANEQDALVLNSGCFLPTKDLADQYIEDQLSSNYIPVKINVETVSLNGNFVWTREVVPQWGN